MKNLFFTEWNTRLGFNICLTLQQYHQFLLLMPLTPLVILIIFQFCSFMDDDDRLATGAITKCGAAVAQIGLSVILSY